jgi:hypothetical protein
MGAPGKSREDYRVRFTDRKIGLIDATRVITRGLDERCFLPLMLTQRVALWCFGRAASSRIVQGANTTLAGGITGNLQAASERERTLGIDRLFQ